MDTPKRLFGPALLTNSAADKYTVPSSTTAIIKNIIVNNTSGSAATFTLSIGADAAGTELFTAVSIAANTTVVYSVWIVMAAAEKIQALSGTTSVLNLTLNGIEIS